MVNALVKPAWLLVESTVQDYLGHASYGEFAALWHLTTLLATAFEVGTTLLAAQVVARPAEAGSDGHETYRAVLGLRLTLQAAYLLVVPLVCWLLGYQGPQLVLAMALALVQGALAALQFSRAVHQGGQRFVVDGILSAADKLVLLGLVLVWLKSYPPSSLRYAGLMLASVLPSLALSLVVLYRKGHWVAPRFTHRSWRPVIHLALPLALMGILAAVNERIGGVVLERLAGSYEAGLYAAAYRWIGGIQNYIWIVGAFFFARFAHLGAAPTAGARFTLQQALIYTGVPMSVAAAVCVVHPQLFLGLLRSSQPQELASIATHMRCLGVGLLACAIATPFGTWLSALGHARRMVRVLALTAAAVLAATTLTLWVSQTGWVGWVYTGHHVLLAIAYVYLFGRVSGQPRQLGLVVRVVAAFGAATGTLWLAETYLPLWVGVALATATGLAAGVPLALAKKIVRRTQPEP